MLGRLQSIDACTFFLLFAFKFRNLLCQSEISIKYILFSDILVDVTIVHEYLIPILTDTLMFTLPSTFLVGSAVLD